MLGYLPGPAPAWAPNSPPADPPPPEPFCPTLPSSVSAHRLVTGHLDALPAVVRDLALRSVLVGVGMAVAGEREHLVRNALAGSVGIEVFVLGYAFIRARQACCDGVCSR